jgi:hypothetical protein
MAEKKGQRKERGRADVVVGFKVGGFKSGSLCRKATQTERDWA